jgi:hypothetical protein
MFKQNQAEILTGHFFTWAHSLGDTTYSGKLCKSNIEQHVKGAQAEFGILSEARSRWRVTERRNRSQISRFGDCLR